MIMRPGDEGQSWQEVYRLCITAITPRPIGFVSTLSRDGTRNLAPFSFFNMVSANPPVLMFCPGQRRDGTDKDTLVNAVETGEFVVSVVTEDMTERMNACAFDYPPEIDEFEMTGLTPGPSTLVRPSLVVDSPVNLECCLLEVRRFGNQPGAGAVVFGEIVAIHVDDDVLAKDGLIDPLKLKAVGRLGRLTYCRVRDVFDLPRP